MAKKFGIDDVRKEIDDALNPPKVARPPIERLREAAKRIPPKPRLPRI